MYPLPFRLAPAYPLATGAVGKRKRERERERERERHPKDKVRGGEGFSSSGRSGFFKVLALKNCLRPTPANTFPKLEKFGNANLHR
jgi:hypothetical protein